jgi:hypothetical protein
LELAMNDHEAQRIADALHAARPDWPARSLLTLIRKHLIDRPRRDVFVALAWVASEPASHTPARVLESGPWWRAAGVEGTVANRPEPWEPDKICTTCSGTREQCDNRPRYADDDHEFVSRAANAQQTERPAEAVARIVTSLREHAADEPPVRPEPEMSSNGTAAVQPARAALAATREEHANG